MLEEFDEANVLARISVKPAEVEFTLIVADAKFFADDGWQRRLVLEEDGRQCCNLIANNTDLPKAPWYRYGWERGTQLANRELISEDTVEVDGLLYGLRVMTETYRDGTIERRISTVVRSPDGTHEHCAFETHAGYVNYVDRYVPPPAPPAPPAPELTADLLARAEDGWQCTECEELTQSGDEISLYECSRCGQATVERRCEECNIFVAKLSDNGCPQCEAAELEPARLVSIDNTLWRINDDSTIES